jgi:hypothetical protein
MPPLTHHRAYGSLPRRFGGLSTRQLFHGKQTQTTEASFGKGRDAGLPRSSNGCPFGLKIAAPADLPSTRRQDIQQIEGASNLPIIILAPEVNSLVHHRSFLIIVTPKQTYYQIELDESYQRYGTLPE